MTISKLKGTPPVKSVADVIEIVRRVHETDGPTFLYRGQGNKAWDVAPGILRPGREGLLENESSAVRDLISVQPSEFSNDQTMFDRLVRMQHFGLPTRLLDVTSNPLVGLYFACNNKYEHSTDGSFHIIEVPKHRIKYYDSDAVSCLSNLSNMTSIEKSKLLSMSHEDRLEFNKDSTVDRLIQFIRMEKPYFRSEINPVDLFRTCYVIPKLSNRRIVAQSGSFLLFGLDHKAGPKYERDVRSHPVRVDAASKEGIMEELRRLSITPSALFPEIESAAAFVSNRYS